MPDTVGPMLVTIKQEANTKTTKVSLVLAGLALAMFAPPNVSAANAPDAASHTKSLRWYGNGITVIVHSGTKPIPVIIGYNDVDLVRSVNCQSIAGCMITVAATVQVQNVVGVRVSSFVDGAEATPPGVYDSNNAITIRQVASIRQGKHTFQTKLYSLNNLGTIVSWVVEYTTYDRAAPG